MAEQVKVAFASGPAALNRQLIERMTALYPELPLYVVSEFSPESGTWIRYHVVQSFFENFQRCRWALRGKRLRLAGVLLVPNMPYRRMRLIALLLSPRGFLAFNEHLGSFMLRPRCAGTILRHLVWRARNFVRWQLRPRPWRLLVRFCLGIVAGSGMGWLKWLLLAQPSGGTGFQTVREGISIVIPSRNGKDLLAKLAPVLIAELKDFVAEIIVVDNGSEDGTLQFLKESYPEIRIEFSREPLSFARAVNLGIGRARYSHVCLLNNDMLLQPGFFRPLRSAFDAIPDLFCAAAQIFFPAGERREETGKAVMARNSAMDFPIRCDFPLPGEDLSYVLYGSGGCSLYSAAKLAALGSFEEIYSPAYVEDLDIGYRAWQRGWPSVFVAGARAVHYHRATTSRYFSGEQLASMIEVNYLRFLARAVASPRLFRRLWSQAMRRLYHLALEHDQAAIKALRFAPRCIQIVRRPARITEPEDQILALGSGDVAVFPGRAVAGKPVVLVASPYLPFPLSHGGAVRIFNLMRRAAKDYTQILAAFSDRLARPADELLDICAEIVVVRRAGAHSRPTTSRPEVVEEFDSLAMHAALRQCARKWQPEIAQLEFTQMAQYAPDCGRAATVLVEHDVTFDLYEQLWRETGDWDVRRQLQRWRKFETWAWRQVECVIAMSEQDRGAIQAARREVLVNGVDLERFHPCPDEPEPRRLLFIGSFAHRPNVMAIEFFLREVWPRLERVTLHIIAGVRHESFLNGLNLNLPGVEVEGFVPDVRSAYRRAALVIAPLVVSAGTNIKILEAMAMGKAIISTPAGVNGLDLSPDEDVIVTRTAPAMANAIYELLGNPARRRELEQRARATVCRKYNWDGIAEQQKRLYESLRPKMA